VNGDGYDDLIVGAPGFTEPEADEGAAFVFYGSTSGPSTSADWSVEGNRPGAQFGYCVASAGDVNGDGYADIIVGAPYFEHGEYREGVPVCTTVLLQA